MTVVQQAKIGYKKTNFFTQYMDNQMGRQHKFDFSRDNDFPNFLQSLKITNAGCELLGLCKGIISDQLVTPKEVQYLISWMKEIDQNKCSNYLKAIINDLSDFLEKGFESNEERKRLFEILHAISHNTSTNALEPFNFKENFFSNDYKITYENKLYCVTQTCIFGTHNKCYDYLTSMGAYAEDKVTEKTDVLIVGSLVTKSCSGIKWPNKISDALKFKSKGYEIKIISEALWLQDVFENRS